MNSSGVALPLPIKPRKWWKSRAEVAPQSQGGWEQKKHLLLGRDNSLQRITKQQGVFPSLCEDLVTRPHNKASIYHKQGPCVNLFNSHNNLL